MATRREEERLWFYDTLAGLRRVDRPQSGNPERGPQSETGDDKLVDGPATQ